MTTAYEVRPDGRTYRPRKAPSAFAAGPARVMVVRTHHVPTATRLALALIHARHLEQVQPRQEWLRWVPWPANQLTTDGHWVTDEARGVPAVIWNRDAVADLDLLGAPASSPAGPSPAPMKDHPDYVRHLDSLTFTGGGDAQWTFWGLAPDDECQKTQWRNEALYTPGRDIVWLIARGRIHRALVDTTTGEVLGWEPYLTPRDAEYRRGTIRLAHKPTIRDVFGRKFEATCSCGSWGALRRDTRAEAERDHANHLTSKLLDRSHAS